MSDGTSIEWTDASWNPIRAMHSTPDGPKLGWHCTHMSEGCRNCYAESFNRRLGTGFDYKPGHLMRPGPFPGDAPRGDVSLFLDEKMLELPLGWRRPRKIFVCSMTDLFADFVEDAWLDAMFAVMAASPQHIFQVLTKRPERLRDYAHSAMGCGEHWLAHCERSHAPMWPLENVWLGVSVEDQAAAETRIPLLLETPGAIRWLSLEPLLGPVDITPWLWGAPSPCAECPRDADCSCGFETRKSLGYPSIGWAVVGGESGPGARPMHPDWVVSLHNQCEAAAVPFLFKQWGAFLPDQIGPEDSRSIRHPPGHVIFKKVGKKAAGRKLFGVEHNGYPI